METNREKSGMDWYHASDGRQVGPVEESAIRERIESGAIGRDDLVWNETLGDQWRPAGSVPEFAGLFAGPAAAGGTGGATPNALLMREARGALSGKWGVCIGVTLLFGFTSWIVSTVTSGIGMWLIGGPLLLGLHGFFLLAVRGRESPGVGRLFDGFSRFGAALGLYLLIAVFLTLWMLLAAIPAGAMAAWFGVRVLRDSLSVTPGQFPAALSQAPVITIWLLLAILPVAVAMVIVQLRYALAYFALADDPGLGPLSALKRSIELMRGRKGKLFCLYCRFIGWALLSTLACGIGWIWLSPYMSAAQARFYDDVRAP